MLAKLPDWARRGESIEGNRYGVGCSNLGEGEIYGFSEQRVIMRFGNVPTARMLMYGWIWLPVFVVSQMDGPELFRVTRVRRWPRPGFEISSGGLKVGEIAQANPVYARYEIDLQSGLNWRLVLPLFSAWFFGSSSAGGRLLVRKQTHYQWLVAVDADHDCPFLIPALAFIHREYLRHQ